MPPHYKHSGIHNQKVLTMSTQDNIKKIDNLDLKNNGHQIKPAQKTDLVSHAFAYLLENSSEQQLVATLKNRSENVATGYKIRKRCYWL